jgi:hypothetical protein
MRQSWTRGAGVRVSLGGGGNVRDRARINKPDLLGGKAITPERHQRTVGAPPDRVLQRSRQRRQQPVPQESAPRPSLEASPRIWHWNDNRVTATRWKLTRAMGSLLSPERKVGCSVGLRPVPA